LAVIIAKNESCPFGQWLLEFEAGLPRFDGWPIAIGFENHLHVSRRRLHSGGARGRAIWAASFIRERRTVLDTELLKNEPALRGILTHELFHFAWVRAGNPARRSFARLLQVEIEARARGELGESAGVHKEIWLGFGGSSGRRAISGKAQHAPSARVWAEYVCESFCDTCAWLLSPREPWPAALPEKWRLKRQRWFESWIAAQERGIRV
jgi:hypothetical protein